MRKLEGQKGIERERGSKGEREREREGEGEREAEGKTEKVGRGSIEREIEKKTNIVCFDVTYLPRESSLALEAAPHSTLVALHPSTVIQTSEEEASEVLGFVSSFVITKAARIRTKKTPHAPASTMARFL